MRQAYESHTAMRACGTTTACCSRPLCALVLDWTACCMLSEPVDLTDPIQSVLHCTLEHSTANRTTRCGKGKAHTASPPELSPASVTRAASPPKTPTRARSHCSATMTSLSPADHCGGRMALASARTQPLSNTHHTISIDHHLRHDAALCKRATDTTQHATLNIQHATRNTQHATHNMQQTYNLPCATCNVVRHASCHGTTVHTQLAVSLSHRSSLRWRRTRVRAPYSRRSRAARACGVPESEPPLVRSL